jgi:hypothetical protein
MNGDGRTQTRRYGSHDEPALMWSTSIVHAVWIACSKGGVGRPTCWSTDGPVSWTPFLTRVMLPLLYHLCSLLPAFVINSAPAGATKETV